MLSRSAIPAEKQGGSPRPNWQFKAFRKAIDDSGLIDLG